MHSFRPEGFGPDGKAPWERRAGPGGGGGGGDGGGRVIRMPQLPGRWFGFLGWPLFLIIVAIWLATGLYQVRPGEVAVVRTFGKVTRVSEEGVGLQYRLPWPIERVDTPRITETRRIEVGFRTVREGTQQFQAVPEERHMITGDENVVDLDFIVQYRISDPVRYLFALRNPVVSVRDGAEAAIRQVVGRKNIDDVLTVGKAEVQNETLQLLQRILDIYDSGIRVITVQLQDVEPPREVQAAFRDVVSAKEDKQKLVNEAEAYRNDVLPKARGEAAKALQEAEAYKREAIARAEGDAQRFTAMLKEYREGKDVTRTRLYLEAMEMVLPHMEIYVVDNKSAQGLVPYLPLTRTGEVTR